MLHKNAKTILNKHKKRDTWFLDDYSVNPYEGCSCNCLYCYIRGSKYGENMEKSLAVKDNALELLDKELSRRAKNNQHGFVAVGSATDAYIRQEEKALLTQGMLRLLLAHRFPVFISTKRSLILRDIDLLKQIEASAIIPEDLVGKLKKGLILSVSVSTMNEKISHELEPGADPPLKRLELLQELKREGFLVGVNAIPMLPFISDTVEDLEITIRAAQEYGADYILVGGLTLFGEGPPDSKTLYYRFLKNHDESLIPRYKALYGNNFYPPFAYQNELKEKAARISKKYMIRNSIIE